MGNELKLNSAEEAEVILIRLTPEEYRLEKIIQRKSLQDMSVSKQRRI